jgi:predicted dehydrogenase
MNDNTIVNTEVKPRLGFLGTGWIGLNRMKALLEKDVCLAAGVCDTLPENAIRAKEAAAGAEIFDSLEEMMEAAPDGIVIATPSALHYEQCLHALRRGISVFCQKPLARTAAESREIIDMAKKQDKLLGIDLSYRYTHGMQQIEQLVRSGELGDVYSADLVFHNAYGPDKAWFYSPKLSGGGCLIDLGIHLVDLAMWIMEFPDVKNVSSFLTSGGKVIFDPSATSEDYTSAQIETVSGSLIRITCSWNLPAGKDAEIKAAFYGTRASAVFENVNGSFFDFEARLNHGTSSRIISLPPDDWGGRALVSWAEKLRESPRFDEEVSSYEKVAGIIDRIYGRTPGE